MYFLCLLVVVGESWKWPSATASEINQHSRWPFELPPPIDWPGRIDLDGRDEKECSRNSIVPGPGLASLF